MLLSIAEIMGISGFISETPDIALIAAAVCGVIVVLFVTMIIDFLARILSRFIPRWNRNS